MTTALLISAFLVSSSLIQSVPTVLAQPKPATRPYYQGPYIDRLVITNILETLTVWEAFKRGELTVSGQYMGTIPLEDMLAAAERDPNIQLLQVGRTTFEGYLGFNMLKWPTSELAVRKAIAHLIDYEYASTMIWKPGVAGPTWGYAPPLFEEWVSPEVNMRARYPYSLELAKKELTDAGWTFSDGKWYNPDGKEMGTLKYVCPGYSPERIEVGVKLREDSAKIGIAWDVVYPPDWPSTERMTYIERDFNLFANYGTADALNPARWYFAAFHSSMWFPPGTSSINHFGVKDPDMDNLTEKLMTTNDLDEAKTLAYQIQKLVEDEVYVMPLIHSFAPMMGLRKDQFRDFLGIKPLPDTSTEDPTSVWQGYFFMMNVKPVGATYGGTYVENRAYWPSSYNPLNWMEAPEQQTYQFIYLPLARRYIAPDGKDEVAPMLAQDWKVETWEVAPGKLGNKYTFHLFRNVTWHDGTPFTADDVKFTFDFVSALKTASAVWAPIIPVYVKSEVLDKYTVVIYTRETGLFQFYSVIAAYILPKHIWERLPDPFAFENLPPIGTGPLVWEDYKPREYISLRANPRYHFAARRLTVETILAETEKVVGDAAKFQFKLTGPAGEAVTNGTLSLSLLKAGEEVYTTRAVHVGEGRYEATIDTGQIGTGDYIMRAAATYPTALFTYEAPITVSLTVLPEVYRSLVADLSSVKADISTLRETITGIQTSVSGMQASVSEMQRTVADVSGLSGIVYGSIGLSVVSVIVAVVAIAYAARAKKPGA